MVKILKILKRNVKVCLPLIALLASSQALSKKEDSETKKSQGIDPVLGVDLNRNNIRDDVENFIKKSLGIKDEKLQKAYLNYAESVSLQLKFRFNKAKLKMLDDQYGRDMFCIMALNKSPNARDLLEKISEEIHDTPIRVEARYQMLMTLESTDLKVPPKSKWLSLCRK